MPVARHPPCRSVLAEAEAAEAKLAGAKVSVSGNTDTVGSNTYNDTLSQLRASAVAKAMVIRRMTLTLLPLSLSCVT